jgi:ParB family transcriptional regulator, chromosome partitioning protein
VNKKTYAHFNLTIEINFIQILQDSDVVNNEKLGGLEALNTMSEIDVEAIEVNPFQPRTYFDPAALQELAESIRVQGIIQPITVRQLDHNHYQLISGERRLQASKIAGLKTIPAYVRTANDQQMLEMALIENIQRENLNAIEIALSYQRLISECDLKQDELGERVGKNRTTVNNYIRLLKLPPEIQVALRDNKISMGHARAIINIENVETKLAIFNKIVEEDMSVRRVEEIVRELSSKTPAGRDKKSAAHALNYEFNQIQSRLSTHFGTKVNIKTSENNKGEIKIPFTSEEDLNRILELLNM